MNPLATPLAWDLVSDAYSTHVTPVLQRYAARALQAACLPRRSYIIDVATGPGTLAMLAAREGHRVAALDFSPKMISALEKRITIEAIETIVGDGTALPFGEGTFDAGFSMFGIMLFEDRAKGLSELHRVVQPGGVGVISSWPPAEQRPLFAAIFGALQELMPSKEPPFPPGLSTPEDCRREMQDAGFIDIEVFEFTDAFEAESFADLWRWFPSACAPLALMRERMGAGYDKIDAKLRERALATVGDGPQRVEMPAFITMGRRRR